VQRAWRVDKRRDKEVTKLNRWMRLKANGGGKSVG